MDKKIIVPTNVNEEVNKGRIALWLDPEDIHYLANHCCCGQEVTQEQHDRCMRIRFRAHAALHKSNHK